MTIFERKKSSGGSRRKSRAAGFSLVEMLVAAAIFVIVSGAAFSLIATHQPLFSRQQNIAGLNISMRNAAAQMQIDIVNAGTGYYAGANIPGFPIGVTIQNSNPGTGCNTPSTYTYSATCFDTLNVIGVDPNTPPAHPTDSGSNCVSTTSSILFATPTGTTTLAQLAGDYHSGDQILVVKSDGSLMTTAILTKDGSVTGGKVQLQHRKTGASGLNTSTDDPLGISTTANNKLGEQYCATDWVMKISPITYAVDVSNSADPKLTRTAASTTSVIADQIIGFKVGAATWNSSATDDTISYSFDPTTYGSDYTLVRSIRISMIGRTTPLINTVNSFRNSFDQGPYQIEGLSVVVNPRNLSMRD